MGYWSIIVPEATKNYLPNPSLETGTTGYTNYATGTAAGTRARSLVWQKRDAYAYKVEKTGGGAADHWGFSAACNNPTDFASGEKATFSVDLNITAGSVVIKIEATVGGTPESTTETIVGPVSGRYDVTHTLSGNATAITAYVYISTATGLFYADGLQVENLDHATTYCDGTRPGCTWAGTAHNSTSTRPVTSRAGGREYNLDTYGYYVRESPGIGLPSITHLVHPLAQLPGSLLRGFKVNARAFTLVATNTPATRADLHSKRKALIGVIGPDLVRKEPVLLRYTGANASTPVEIAVTYDGGLEFGSPDGFSEETPIRLIAYDPMWAEEGDTADSLNTLNAVTSVNKVVRQEDGIWAAMGTGCAGAGNPLRTKQGPDRKIYLVGTFTGCGGVANTGGVAVWNPVTDTFEALGTGLSGHTCRDLAWDNNGILWVADDTNGLYQWDGATWTQVATCAGGGVYSVAIADDGTMYVAGTFTTFDGVARNRAAKSTDGGATWTELATTGLNNGAYHVLAHPGGQVYFAGGFTTAGGTTVYGTAEYDPVANTFAALGSGITVGDVRRLLIARDGTLFAGGTFATIGGVTGTSAVAHWTGVNWEALGSGMGVSTPAVYDMVEDEDGRLWVVGNFTQASGITLADRMAVWNRSTWVHPDVDLPGTSSVVALCVADTGDLYIGFEDTGTTVNGSALTTVTNSTAAEVYPQIVVSRSGGTSATVQWIENETIGAILYVNHSLADGETLTIDLTPGARSVVSSVHGPIMSAILQASDLADFKLAPGENTIRAFVQTAGSPTVTAYMQWQNRHLSADGVAA